MTDSHPSSAGKRIGVLAGLALASFTVGAIVGYMNGSSGAAGNSERALRWSIQTGFLFLGMIIFITMLGTTVLTKLNVPPMIGWAILFGLAFSIMSGGGVLLGMDDRAFVSQTIGGLLTGAIIGAIAGPIIEKNQSRLVEKPNSDKNSNSDETT